MGARGGSGALRPSKGGMQSDLSTAANYCRNVGPAAPPDLPMETRGPLSELWKVGFLLSQPPGQGGPPAVPGAHLTPCLGPSGPATLRGQLRGPSPSGEVRLVTLAGREHKLAGN